eukprot:10470417-Alexandrium_andersonii.AAC.1
MHCQAWAARPRTVCRLVEGMRAPRRSCSWASSVSSRLYACEYSPCRRVSLTCTCPLRSPGMRSTR